MRAGAVVLALLGGSLPGCRCACDTEPPPRPATVPPEAAWAGGGNGGAWIACAAFPGDSARYACSVYFDDGRIWAERDFVLGSAKEGDAPASTTSPAELRFDAFDGKRIRLVGGGVLEPDPQGLPQRGAAPAPASSGDAAGPAPANPSGPSLVRGRARMTRRGIAVPADWVREDPGATILLARRPVCTVTEAWMKLADQFLHQYWVEYPSEPNVDLKKWYLGVLGQLSMEPREIAGGSIWSHLGTADVALDDHTVRVLPLHDPSEASTRVTEFLLALPQAKTLQTLVVELGVAPLEVLYELAADGRDSVLVKIPLPAPELAAHSAWLDSHGFQASKRGWLGSGPWRLSVGGSTQGGDVVTILGERVPAHLRPLPAGCSGPK